MKKRVKLAITILIIVAISGINACRELDQAIYDKSVDAANYENIGELCDGTVVEQVFTSEYGGMRGISIRMATWERKSDSKLKYSLIEKQSGSCVAEGTIISGNLLNNEYNQIMFPEIKESRGKTYILKIQDESVKQGEGVTIFSTQKGEKAGVLSVNGKASQEALVVKVIAKEFNVESFIVSIGLLMYIIGFVKLLYRFLR